MKKTKIVCTLGPAVDNEELVEQLVLAGLNVARFNFSHGTHEEQYERYMRFKKVCKKVGVTAACMLDTKGPELRLGTFEEPVTLNKGDTFILTTDECVCTKEKACVSHKTLHEDVKVGTHILIDDGLVEIEVTEINGNDIICTVLNSGTVSSKKSLNVPSTKLSLPSLTEKDIEDLKFAAENDFDYIAASFIQCKEDILIIRKYLENFEGKNIRIIAKIENEEGIKNFDEILEVSDGIMVARGDLGVEVPVEKLPILQKEFIHKTVAAGKLVITATQMLDSMMKNPRPTRAEVSDVANAIIDGTCAIMLSGETANGSYPVNAVQMMNKIALTTEASIDYSNSKFKPIAPKDPDLADKDTYRECINYSVYISATTLSADAIICVSEGGKSPRVLSKFRPACPILVITPNDKTARLLSGEWGIKCICIPESREFDYLLNNGINKFKELGLLKQNDTVILSGGATHEHSEDGLHKQMLGGIIRI